ncbi:MAG: hypothetical protein MJA84_14375, partial [Firmicutes bacterium]|nr:hypothetical protein [Bacillota bacterium]
ELEKAKDDKLQIAGDYTDLASTSYFSEDNEDDYEAVANSDSFADLLGVDVTAYLNTKGDIAYVKGDVEETTDTFYGFAISVDDFNDKIKITRSVDGEEDDVSYDTDLDDDFVELNEINFSTDGDTDELNSVTDRLGGFYKFTIDEDSVITKIETTTKTPLADVDEFDEDADTISDSAPAAATIYMEEDTLIFKVSIGSDIEVLSWNDIKETDVSDPADIDVHYADSDETAPDFVLIDDTNDITSASDADEVSFGGTDGFLGLVLEMERVDADNYEIELAINGDIKTFTVDEDDDMNVDVDAVVAYKMASGTDTIEVVAEATYDDLTSLQSISAIATDDDDNWTRVGGEVDDIDASYITIGGTDFKVASDAIIYKVSGDDMDEFT